MIVIVMGVSGSGKTTVGELLAERLGCGFSDADDFHPAANVDKMRAGIPLTDDDRWPWLDAVGGAFVAAADTGLGMACSALRRVYRDRIRSVSPDAVFVHLTGSRELLTSRASARTDHFMPASLLESQLATLEELDTDEAGIDVTVDRAPDELVTEIVERLAR